MSQQIQIVSGPQLAQPDDELENEPGLEIEPDKFPHERYKPFRLIGKGASGTVYLCWDKLLAKRVAIKILHHLETSQLVAFQQEARTMSRLNHENIIKILDFGATESGVPFMVMEIIRGASLMNYIVELGSLQPPAAVYLIRQICHGLSHAHSVGVFHRDIKSSNILVSDLGTEMADAKLIDFGVANLRVANQSPSADRTSMVGSPFYMAPDMAMGLQYTERSEIYSLGCCLFEALTGKVPFEGESPLEVISLHAQEEPPTLIEAAPDMEFSDELEHLVFRCLSKNPDDRYTNTQELADALKALPEYHGKDVVVQPQSSLDKTVFDESQNFFPTQPEASAKKSWKNPIAMFSLVAAIIAGAIVLVALRPQTAYNPATRIYSTFWNDENIGKQLTDEQLAQRRVKKPRKNNKADKAADTASSLDEYMNDTEGIIDKSLKKHTYHRADPKVRQPHSFVKEDSESILGQGDVRDEDLAELKNQKFKAFTLDQCNVTGAGVKYLRSSGITFLCIESSLVNDDGVKEIAQIKTLTHLYLRGNPITNAGIKHLEKVPLESLFISQNKIDDTAFDTIGKIKTLKRLEMKGTQTTVKAMGEKLSGLPLLYYLDIDKITPCPEMEGIEKLTHLTYLKADNLRINDLGLKRISKMSISSLDVQYCHFHDTGLLYLEKMPKLTRLNVSHCFHITPSSVARLKHAKPGLDLVSVQD